MSQINYCRLFKFTKVIQMYFKEYVLKRDVNFVDTASTIFDEIKLEKAL